MKYETITIISEIENDVQAWTFAIEEADLLALVEKYGARGCNVRTSAEDIGDTIQNIYR